MMVHLIDGTYEFFRHFYGLRRFNRATATDHVIESFRNALWPTYKTGEGIEPALVAQFHPLEDALPLIAFPGEFPQ